MKPQLEFLNKLIREFLLSIFRLEPLFGHLVPDKIVKIILSQKKKLVKIEIARQETKQAVEMFENQQW